MKLQPTKGGEAGCARVQPSGTRRSPRTRFLDLKVLKIGSIGRSGHRVSHACGQGPVDSIASRGPPGLLQFGGSVGFLF